MGKLNDSKTEFIILGSKKNLAMISTYSVTVGDSSISASVSVKSTVLYIRHKELSELFLILDRCPIS